jgi:exopolyphosphatase/pppGpp-phosphohydrolase
MRSFGKGVQAAVASQAPKRPRTVCIIDIGSNSLKATVFDCRQHPPRTIDHYDKIIGLAQGMVPNDPKPRLNRTALQTLFDKALPNCRDLIESNKVEAVTVLCTEAVRAVQRHDPATIKAFRQKVATALGIPKQAVNVISEITEATLAAKAVIYGNERSDGFVVTAGGASTELAEVRQGQIRSRRCATLRFGARTLAGHGNPRKVIQQGLGRTDWFRARRRQHHTRDAAGHDANRDLVLQGGSFRVVGRLLAENIYNIGFDSTIPFGGYTFAWDGQVKDQLLKLRSTRFDKLENDFIRQEHPERCDASVKDLGQWRNTKSYTQWTATPRYKKWHKRIGQRADFIAASVEIILAVEQRVNPTTVTFSAQSMREGALKHAQLV